jgi:GH24 family phage-related lysozyme (muramidase)
MVKINDCNRITTNRLIFQIHKPKMMDPSEMDISGLLGDQAIASVDDLLMMLKQGKKLPKGISPEIMAEFRKRIGEDSVAAKIADNAAKQGLMTAVPGIGHAVAGIDSLVQGIAPTDEYGIDKSDFSAGVKSLLSPISRGTNMIKDVQKDGFQAKDLLNLVPVLGGITRRKDQLKEKERAQKKQKTIDTADRIKSRSQYFTDLYQGLADGGMVEGKGTSKSDSIKTKLKAGSFVVPSENAQLAMQLGQELLGWNKNEKADKGSGESVAISDGEVVFQPDEVQTLREFGIDVEALAPEAEDADMMKKGGKVKGYADGGWVKMATKLISDSEGDRNKAYKDTNGNITIGRGLMLFKRNQNGVLKPNMSVIQQFAKRGFSEEDIIALAKGEKELDGETAEKIYQDYFNNVLEPELKESFKTKWNQMSDESKAIAADLMYNQGAPNFNSKRWDDVRIALAKNKPQEAMNVIGSSPQLQSWRDQTKGRAKKIAENLALNYEGLDRQPGPIDERTDLEKEWKGLGFDEAISTNTRQAALRDDTRVKDAVVPGGKTATADVIATDIQDEVSDEFPDLDLGELQLDQIDERPIFPDIEGAGIPIEASLIERNIAEPELAPLPIERQIFDTEPDPEKDNSDIFNLGNLLALGQVVGGITGLARQGNRPEDTIGEGITNWVEELRNEEADGFTAEEWSTYTNEIENIRRNDLSAISSLVGGDAGLAMASIVESGNRANKAMSDLAAQDASIRRDEENRIRNQRANAEFFYENRRSQVIDKQIEEFDRNQDAYAELLSAGVHNLVGNQDPLYRSYMQKFAKGGTVKKTKGSKDSKNYVVPNTLEEKRRVSEALIAQVRKKRQQRFKTNSMSRGARGTAFVN